ncbi:hypothetical protein UFOVP131_46 [uncultured Caudovirales phage]|uniref:Uncharacterized protein n=1 Tax=uncultured Caudovirales phage TaxID=2100421 RepID=A0A6J5LCI3_9CAUD|nr:hypothetical protein UFOVP131_46 [uncultured Caudovirales phage]
MAIIPVPTGFGFSEVTRFQLVRASNQMRSRFTGARQVLVYPFAIWQLEAKLVEADGAKAGRFRSFLAQLDGVANKFRLPVPGYYRPSTGYAGGNPESLNNVEVRAQSFVMHTLIPNVPFLNEGDFFCVNDELKIVTASVASNQDGRALVSFKPALRKPVNGGTQIVIINPTILMHSDDDDAATWNLRPPFRQNTTFSASEAIEL